MFKSKLKKIFLVNKSTKLIIGILLSATLFFGFAGKVLASSLNVELASDSEVGQILIKYSEYFQMRNIFTDAWRWITWGLIKALYGFTYFLESFVEESLTFYKFVESIYDHNIYTSMLSGLVGALLAGSLVWVMVKMILNQGEVPKFKTVGFNLAAAVILLTGMPTLMGWMQDGVIAIWGTSDGISNSVSQAPIKKNVVDLYIPLSGSEDAEDFFSSDHRNGFSTPDTLKFVEERQFYTPGSQEDFGFTGTFSETLNYTIETRPSDKESYEYLSDLTQESNWFLNMVGMGGAIETGYYRYTYNTLTILITLGSLCVGFTYVIFNIIKSYIEIAFKLIFGIVIIATDLETGQKRKALIQDIINAFLAVAFESISFRIFVIYTGWLSEIAISPVLYIFGMVAGVGVLLEGSRTILKHFGIDTGLKEGRSEFGRFLKWTGAKMAAQGLMKGGKSAYNKVTGNKNGGESTNGNGNGNRNDLESQVDKGEAPDINKSMNSSEMSRSNKAKKALTNGLNKSAEAYGYVKERGLGNTIKDVVSDVSTAAKESIEEGGNAAVDSVKTAGEWVEDHTVTPIKRGVNGTIAAATAGAAVGALVGSSRNEFQNDSIDSNKTESNESGKLNQNRQDGSTNNENMESNESIRSSLDRPDINEMNQESSGTEALESRVSRDRIISTTDREENHNNNQNKDMNNRNGTEQIKSVVDKTDFNNPSEAIKRIREEMVKSGVGQADINTFDKETQNSSHMSPNEAKQHVRQVVDQITGESNSLANQNSMKQIKSDINQSDLSNSSETPRKTQSEFSTQAAQISDLPSSSLNDVRKATQNFGRVEGNSASEKIETIKRQVLDSSKKPEILEQNVKQVVSKMDNLPESKQSEITEKVRRITEDTPLNSQNVQSIKQRIDQEISPLVKDLPMNDRKNIIQQVQEASVGNTQATQKVVQQVEQAKFATPQQLNSNIARAVTNTSVPLSSEVIQTVKQRIEKVNSQDLQPAVKVQKIQEEINSVKFGNQESLKPQVQEGIKQAIYANDSQAQSNLKKVVVENRQHTQNGTFKTAESSIKRKEDTERNVIKWGSQSPSDYSVFNKGFTKL